MTSNVSLGRRNDDPHLEVLNTLLQEVSHLRQELMVLAELKPGLENHIEQEEIFQQKLLKMAQEAFVDGDPVLHRLDHEARLKRAKLCAAFWDSMFAKLGEKTIFGVITVAGLLIVYWLSGHQIIIPAVTSAPK